MEIPAYEGFSEGNPEWGNGDDTLKRCVRIFPHKMAGEGHFIALLKKKGILRKGKLEFVEKNKKDKSIIYLELTDEVEKQLFDYIQEIEALIAEEKPPECIHKNTCKKCAYYEYCYI